MKRKIGRIVVAMFLTAIILAVTVEAAETICPANPDDQKWSFDWNFDRTEWSSFAYFNEQEDSVQIVIGLNKEDNVQLRELIALIVWHGGKIVKNVSTAKEIIAIVAEIPFASIPVFVEKVKATGLARYIEPNLIVRVQVESFPNDHSWSLQWGPKKIEADWAWNATVGSSDVLVAVVDSGIDYTHPDLAANYVGLGYDWANNDPDPMDDINHGTKVTGIIAAQINNGIGIAGLAQVKVMAEKVWTPEICYVIWLANGIVDATNQGAQIISMSWSVEYNYSLIYDAVKYAFDSGVLLVAAAGNQGNDTKRYPAAYDEVIAVAATDPNDNPAEFSNFGDWVELAAPGVDIFTTDLLNENLPPDYQYYRWGSGTSFACPHVSGVAALIWSEFPNATRDWIRTRLRETADDLGDTGFDIYYGYGRINARKAIYGTSPAINYTLTITTTAGGTTNPAPGNHTYTERQNVPVEALPDTGYGLDHWELDGVNKGSVNPYSVLMDNNHTLQAVFVPAYTLTITATTGGTTNPSPDPHIYNVGTSVPVSEIPDTYYYFDHWELDGLNVGSTNPYTVLMDNDYALHAVFVQINYTLAITSTADGTTSPAPDIYTYPAGSNVQVTAIPDTNYLLDHWELDGTNVGSTNLINVTMDTDHALYAVFRLLVNNIALTLVTPSKTIVGQNYSTNIKVTIANQGDFTETFNVTIYANATAIERKEITLSSGASTTLTFIWHTSGFAYGNYTIWAYAEPIPGETDLDDNTLTDGIVTVTIPGDVDADFDVDLYDAVKLLVRYGAKKGNQAYDPNCDIDGDGDIDLYDAVILCNHYGQKYP